MKPLQIGLLVLVGALGGALIMRFTQRPKPAPAPMVSAAPAPVTPAATADALPTSTAALPREAPAPKATPAAVVKMGHHSQPMQRPLPDGRGSVATGSVATRSVATRSVATGSVATRSAATGSAAATVAQNLPPAQPEAPVAPPAPTPIEGPAAPPISVEPAPAPATTLAPAPNPEPAEPPPAPQPAPSVTLQAGMMLPVRLGESLSSEHNQAGDTFTATLDAPLAAGGFVIAEKGARVEGRVVEAQKSGHAKGKATLALELTKLNTSDGQHVDIKTETLRKQGTSMATGDQVGVVAAAAGIGAIIGAIAGGGKGAAIGAGAGGAAGGGGVVATRDKAVSLPTETKISFRLSTPVTITERLK